MQALGRCSSKRKIEAFLSATEAVGPDLIECWGIDSSHLALEDDTGDGRTAEQATNRARQEDCVVDLGGGVWDYLFPKETRESNHCEDHSSLAAVGLTDGSLLSSLLTFS